MSSKVFGFVGMECYDLIFYASKTASELGFEVLMVDLSPNKDLSYLYPGEFNNGDTVDVDGVALIKGKLEKGCFSGYDYILINYGCNPQSLYICDEIYFVTNFQKHNISPLQSLQVPEVPCYLVVRDRGACSMNYDYILNELPNISVQEEDDIYAIEDSDADVCTRVFLQHSMITKFSKLSSSIKDFVKHVLEADFSPKDIDHAWKHLVKG